MAPQSTVSPNGPPLFELTTFLAGRTRAWGIFEDRFGKLRRRIEVEMVGSWRDGLFVLEERFTYDGNETERRTWLVEPQGEGRFRATCPECVGGATGVCDTDSIRMSYHFLLKLEKRTIVVGFHDRIFRVGVAIAVNRATMS